jgi:hypothetical protein
MFAVAQQNGIYGLDPFADEIDPKGYRPAYFSPRFQQTDRSSQKNFARSSVIFITPLSGVIMSFLTSRAFGIFAADMWLYYI